MEWLERVRGVDHSTRFLLELMCLRALCQDKQKKIITEEQKGKESRLDGECGQICNHGRKKGLKEKTKKKYLQDK